MPSVPVTHLHVPPSDPDGVDMAVNSFGAMPSTIADNYIITVCRADKWRRLRAAGFRRADSPQKHPMFYWRDFKVKFHMHLALETAKIINITRRETKAELKQRKKAA
jgi:hypothetical protein